jgi:peptidoglycan/LPS O-acetylase OafA/YrhL
MKLEYYKNLDGTRGIAALMVLVFHFFYFNNASYSVDLNFYRKITEFGQHGVSLFFVLSGFVITRILINTRNEPKYFRTFYWRRVLRILPLYYLYLLFAYFLLPIILDSQFVDFKLQLPYYFYLQNFVELSDIKASGPGHYWSLAVEEHFYLIWPLVIFLVQPKHLWKVIGLSVVIIFVLKYFMLSEGLAINHFTFTRIDQLIIGAVLSVLEYNGFFKKKKAAYYFLIIGLSVFPLAVLTYYFQTHFFFIKEMFKSTLLAMFFFSVLGYLIARKQETTINRILSGKILQYLGKISYGLYVWQVAVIFVLNKYAITGVLILDLSLSVGVSIIVAHISFKYFEHYFLKLKEKQAYLGSSQLFAGKPDFS